MKQFESQSFNPPYVAYLAITLVNIGPLLGVVWGDWAPFDVVFMYWFENVIIGLFVVARMVFKPRGGIAFAVGGLALAGFFLLHYGIFCWAHGMMIMSILGENVVQIDEDSVFNSAAHYIKQGNLQWVALSMLLAHLALYIQAYLGDKIDKAKDEMAKPYRRIIVLHIAIMVGGALATFAPSAAFIVMLLLIAFKIFSDVMHDKRERAEQAEKSQTQPARMVDQIIAQLESEELSGAMQANMEINGQSMSYASYTELRDSAQFQQIKKMARLFMSKKDIARIEAALEERIAREEGCSGVILDGEAQRVREDIKVISADRED